MATIYEIIRRSTTQCYVGHTKKRVEIRWAAHLALLEVGKHHSRYLQRAWDKDGVEQFEFRVIEECQDDQALVREQFYIDTLDSAFNTAKVAGSRLGVLFTEEQKIRLSASRMGHSTSAEAARKIGLAHKGKQWKLGYKLTDEQRSRQWWNDPALQKAAAAKRVGQTRTDEQKQTMSVAQQNNELAGQHRLGFKEDPDQTSIRLAKARAAIEANPHIWITDGVENEQILAAEEIPEGWRNGRTFSEAHMAAIIAAAGPRSDEAKAHMAVSATEAWQDPEKRANMLAARKPFCWINDGTTSKRHHLDLPIPDGWQKGRLIDAAKLIAGRKYGRRSP